MINVLALPFAIILMCELPQALHFAVLCVHLYIPLPFLSTTKHLYVASPLNRLQTPAPETSGTSGTFHLWNCFGTGNPEPKVSTRSNNCPGKPPGPPGKGQYHAERPLQWTAVWKKNMLYAFRVISTWEAQYQINSDWPQSNKSWFYHLS